MKLYLIINGVEWVTEHDEDDPGPIQPIGYVTASVSNTQWTQPQRVKGGK